jgi:hypothetical protein
MVWVYKSMVFRREYKKDTKGWEWEIYTYTPDITVTEYESKDDTISTISKWLKCWAPESYRDRRQGL